MLRPRRSWNQEKQRAAIQPWRGTHREFDPAVAREGMTPSRKGAPCDILLRTRRRSTSGELPRVTSSAGPNPAVHPESSVLSARLFPCELLQVVRAARALERHAAHLPPAERLAADHRARRAPLAAVRVRDARL